MCFLLYISTDGVLPDISWDETSPGLSTQELSDYELGVSSNLTGRNQRYISSEQGCGCGYRSRTFQNGFWPDPGWIGDPASMVKGTEIHNSLGELLASLLPQGHDIALYGCWDGDFSEPKAGEEVITIDTICDPRFYFRERILYKIKS